jgi:hypothetical protein
MMNKVKPLSPVHTDTSGQQRPGSPLIRDPGTEGQRQLTVQAALPDVSPVSAAWLARIIGENCPVRIVYGAEKHDA